MAARRKPSDGEWCPRDEAIALALASGRSQADAADACGVSVRTIRNRLALPAFADLVASLRREMTREALGRLSAVASQAADTLAGLLDSAQPAGIRLQAANIILSQNLKMQDHADLAERVARLEEADRESPVTDSSA